MGRLLYYLLLKPISYLPLSALYRLSDGLYVLVYRLVGYRKQVVGDNMRRSFPEKSEADIEALMRAFYRHLCDLIVESVKVFSISKKELMRRFHFRNPEILAEYTQQGRSVIVASAHYNSWELSAIISPYVFAHQPMAVYTPLRDPFFNRMIQESRSKFGLWMVSLKELQKFFVAHADQPVTMLFAADQSPSNPRRAHWMTFLNQDTAVMLGTEIYAKRYNYPVFYGRVIKMKRGYYDVEFELITDSPKNTARGEITEAHTKRLEADIRRAPAHWLWSHRRWKHQRKTADVEKS